MTTSSHHRREGLQGLLRHLLILFVLDAAVLLLHLSLGHWIIELIYHDSFLPFLNGIIQGQAQYGVEHYWNLADGLLFKGLAVLNGLYLSFFYISVLLYGLFITVLTFVCLEVVVRFWDPYFPSNYVRDESLGIRHKPNFNSANSRGFNDREYRVEKLSGVTRIVALGDSFNWAGGRELNYWSMVEAEINQDSSGVEILNQGTVGAGPSYLFQLLQRESMQFDPDVVLLSLFVGNDLTESHPDEVLQLRTGYQVRSVSSGGRSHLLGESDLWFFASHKLKMWREEWAKEKEVEAGERRGYFSRETFLRIEKERMTISHPKFYTSEHWEHTKDCIARFQSYLSEKGIPFFVVLLPDEYQVVKGLREEVFQRYLEVDTEHFENDLPQKKLRGYLDSEGVPYLDLLPAFEEAALAGQELYLRSETHFNEEGNRLASQKVVSFLREQGVGE